MKCTLQTNRTVPEPVLFVLLFPPQKPHQTPPVCILSVGSYPSMSVRLRLSVPSRLCADVALSFHRAPFRLVLSPLTVSPRPSVFFSLPWRFPPSVTRRESSKNEGKRISYFAVGSM